MEHERLTQRNNIGGAYYPHCFQESTCYGLGASVKCNSCEFNNEVLEKLATYEDLEEQGLLLRLPCKVGDKVYTPCAWGIESGVVGSIEIISDRVFINNKYGAMIDEAHNVFLTKEEAEQMKAGGEQ